MRAESIVFAIAGAFFGLIVGWMLGAQQAAPPTMVMSAPAQSTAPAAQSAQGRGLDENQVRTLKAVADRDPKNAAPRVELGNLYFDAERFDEAIKWYTEALAVDPRNADASTDLGIAYHYSNQPDRAIKQFEYSLSVSPKHTKTLLNMGVVKAFGKQDLDGAVAAWQKLIQMAPDSQDAQTAQKMLESMKTGHQGMTGSAPAGQAPAAQPAGRKAK